MNQSFVATILFAVLVIAGAFLANLVVLVFTGSQWHVSGVVLAIVAAGASYWAQHNFTQAVYVLATHQSDLSDAYQRAEAVGRAFQVLAIACLSGSTGCFWLGMR